MKANAPKRKIFDAVDLMEQELPVNEGESPIWKSTASDHSVIIHSGCTRASV